MYHKIAVFFIVLGLVAPVGAVVVSDLLKDGPTDYPLTFSDLSFKEQMDTQAEDYSYYDAEFDSNGVCVRGCAWAGITISQDQALSRLATEEAVGVALEYEEARLWGDVSDDGQTVGGETGGGVVTPCPDYAPYDPSRRTCDCPDRSVWKNGVGCLCPDGKTALFSRDEKCPDVPSVVPVVTEPVLQCNKPFQKLNDTKDDCICYKSGHIKDKKGDCICSDKKRIINGASGVCNCRGDLKDVNGICRCPAGTEDKNNDNICCNLKTHSEVLNKPCKKKELSTVPGTSPVSTPSVNYKKCVGYNSTLRQAARTIPIGSPLAPKYTVSGKTGKYPRVSSEYGGQRLKKGSTWQHKAHKGLDMSGREGTPVYTPASGEVIIAGWDTSGCGNYVNVRHEKGFISQYCHLSKIQVKVGDWVEAGCQVGEVGNTGTSNGAHLHYTIKYTGRLNAGSNQGPDGTVLHLGDARYNAHYTTYYTSIDPLGYGKFSFIGDFCFGYDPRSRLPNYKSYDGCMGGC